MGCEEDVVKIGKKLEKMASSDTADQANALDMLKSLKKLPITLDILQKTRIGMTVNNFRKACKNEEVVTLAKSLIKGWKKLLPGESSQSGNSQSLNRSNSTASSAGSVNENSQDAQEVDSKPAKKGSESPKQTTFPARASDTADEVRLKCREMLTNALSKGEDIDGGSDPADMAAAIEECIFQEFKNTDMKYKNRIRSRLANIKDSRNPQLRYNILKGYISPDKLAVMTAEEMASDAMKQLRKQYTKEAIDDHQMSTTGGTQTDLLKCGRCGKRNCTYNQVQTRSADEPMTTFVYCNECGNRWKFC